MAEWPWFARFRPIERWPGELTKSRKVAPFRAGWSRTLVLLNRELEYLSARQVVIQMAVSEQDLRLDGIPRASARPEHPGVIVSLESKHGPLQYPCDTFDFWQDNVRAVALALEALRKVDRYGVTRRGEQYRGWRQLESGLKTLTRREAAEVLLKIAWPDTPAAQIPAMVTDMLADDLMMKGTHRAAMKKAHPDTGVGGDDWSRLQAVQAVLGLR